MDSDQDSPGSDSQPTPRELRAARRRAYDEEKKARAASSGGKGDKKGKGGGDQDPSAGDRGRR